MRLIDAEGLAITILSMARTHDSNYQQGYWRGVDMVLEVAKESPTIDPVKRGEWADCYKSGHKPHNGGVCTACDCWAGRKSDFCPNCGANMKGNSHEKD